MEIVANKVEARQIQVYDDQICMQLNSTVSDLTEVKLAFGDHSFSFVIQIGYGDARYYKVQQVAIQDFSATEGIVTVYEQITDGVQMVFFNKIDGINLEWAVFGGIIVVCFVLLVIIIKVRK